MDRAWQIEQEYWRDSTVGGDGPQGWAAHYMASDGFVVLPNRVVSRDELVHSWEDKPPITSWSATEPTFTVVEGGNLVISYEVQVEADWLPGYNAFITSVYALGTDWTLVCRAHTPKSAFPF